MNTEEFEHAMDLQFQANAAHYEELEEEAPPLNECKVDGCHQPWVSQKGIYGRLCSRHREAAQAVRQRMSGGDADATPVVRGGSNGSPLVQAAEAVDKARQELRLRLAELRGLLEEIG